MGRHHPKKTGGISAPARSLESISDPISMRFYSSTILALVTPGTVHSFFMISSDAI
jgi:hypothetical protein